MYIYVVCISFFALCNLAFGGCIELDQHIQKHILKNNTLKWGDKEIGKKASFDVLRDINYLTYIEENCSEDKILKNSKFYNDTWARVFGKAEKNSLKNMAKKIYEKMANATSIRQAYVNSFIYLKRLIDVDFVYGNLDKDTRQKLKKMHYEEHVKTARCVVEKYTKAWSLEEFSKKVDLATRDWRAPLEINGETVFLEDELKNLKNRNSLVQSVDNAWKEIESELNIELNNDDKGRITYGLVNKIENTVVDRGIPIDSQSKYIDDFKKRLIEANKYYREIYKFDKNKPFIIFALRSRVSDCLRIDCMVFRKWKIDEQGDDIVYRFMEKDLEEVYKPESFYDAIEKINNHQNRLGDETFRCYKYIVQEYKLVQRVKLNAEVRPA